MINAINPTLDITPEAVNGLGMGHAVNVLLGGMVDGLMGIAKTGKPVVTEHFVSVDDRTLSRGDMLLDDWEQCLGLNVRHDLGDSPSPALYNSSNDGLASGPTSTNARALPTDVGFVSLDSAKERLVGRLCHQLPNLGEHSPGGLVRHSKLTLQLLGRDASPGVSHQKHGIEPRTQRRAGLLQDSTSHRRKLISTSITLVNLASLHSVKQRLSLARRTLNAVWVSLMTEPVKAGVIIGKHLVELLLGVPFYRKSPIANLAIMIAWN